MRRKFARMRCRRMMFPANIWIKSSRAGTIRRVCQIFCVNDLDFVVGLGFVFGFVVGLGFAVVVGFGDGVQGKGAFSPSLAYLRRRKPEIALCQSPWPGHALGPQDGEVI